MNPILCILNFPWDDHLLHIFQQLTLSNICLASMKKEIKEGKSPVIRYADRTWNDKSSGVNVTMDAPLMVCKYFYEWLIIGIVQTNFLGQTFCIRSMFSSFMVDDSNIFAFEGGRNSSMKMKYSIDWSIFKPEKNGQQVIFYSGVLLSQIINPIWHMQIIITFQKTWLKTIARPIFLSSLDGI